MSANVSAPATGAPATAGPPLSMEQRLDAILLERVAFGCVAMVGALGALTVVALLDGAWWTAIASASAQVAAAVSWFLIVRGRILPAHAGPLSFFLWLTAEVAVLVAFSHYREVSQELWLALILWAYGAMQLRVFWASVTFVVAPTLWGAAIILLGTPTPLMHVVSIAGAVGVAVLSFGANRAVVRDLERMRMKDAARQEELARALAETQAELAARLAAEAEGERLRAQFVAAQRMEAIGTLAGGVAHDMNNLLAAILGITQAMRAEATGQGVEDLDIIIAAARRGASLTRSLLGFARRAQYQKERLSLASILDEATAMLRRTCPRGITVADHADRNVFVDADRGHMVQVLLNVSINAVQALGDTGRVDITVAREALAGDAAAALEVPPGDYATLSVADNGPGMTPEVRARAFEPFFTTKPVGSGSGLGLAMVWGTVKAHGGAVRVTSTVGAGTCVTCLLPLRDPPTEIAPAPSVERARIRSLRILVVDDEPLVRSAVGRGLTGAGHRVESAVDGLAAVERVTADPDAFELVVLDMAMPRMGGAECYERLRRIRPSLPIVCVSGHSLDDRARALLDSDVIFIAKPFLQRDLDDAIARALGRQI